MKYKDMCNKFADIISQNVLIHNYFIFIACN